MRDLSINPDSNIPRNIAIGTGIVAVVSAVALGLIFGRLSNLGRYGAICGTSALGGICIFSLYLMSRQKKVQKTPAHVATPPVDRAAAPTVQARVATPPLAPQEATATAAALPADDCGFATPDDDSDNESIEFFDAVDLTADEIQAKWEAKFLNPRFEAFDTFIERFVSKYNASGQGAPIDLTKVETACAAVKETLRKAAAKDTRDTKEMAVEYILFSLVDQLLKKDPDVLETSTAVEAKLARAALQAEWSGTAAIRKKVGVEIKEMCDFRPHYQKIAPPCLALTELLLPAIFNYMRPLSYGLTPWTSTENTFRPIMQKAFGPARELTGTSLGDFYGRVLVINKALA